MQAIHRERLTRLAEWLEAGAPHEHVKFNMRTYFRFTGEHGETVPFLEEACGAVCCIAGAATQFFDPDRVRTYCYVGKQVFKHAKNLLGLTWGQAQDLFIPRTLHRDKIKPQDAAKVIRHFLDTGEVDWSIVGYRVSSRFGNSRVPHPATMMV